MGSHRRVLILALGAAAALALALGAVASAVGPYTMTLVITPNPAPAGTTEITLSGHVVDAGGVAQGGGTVDFYFPYRDQGLRQAGVDANGDYTITLTNGTATYVPIYGGTYTYSVYWHWDIGGLRKTAQTDATLTLGGPANNPPSVSLSGVTGGASYEIGEVPSAWCVVTDADEGEIPSFPATLSELSGPNAAHGIGSRTASCSYTDAGHLTATTSVTYSIVDTTRPIIWLVSRSAVNAQGWTSGNVSLTWACTDDGSGVKTAPAPVTVSAEGAGQTATATCIDWAGNSATDVQGDINIDKTPPVTEASGWTSGWVNREVYISFHGTDGLSGMAGCDPSVTLRNEGANQSVTGYCWDMAENHSSATATGINIDRTPPSAQATVTPHGGWNNTAPTVTFSGNDALSGIASCTAPVTVTNQTPGSHVPGTCWDNAGNESAEVSGYVMYDATPPQMIPEGFSLPNQYGWYSAPQSFSWECYDALSGARSESASATLSSEGADQTATASCTDYANNSATASRTHISIDLTDPTVSWTPLSGSYLANGLPAAPTCVAVDLLSGPLTCEVTGYETAPGEHTLTATAHDKAGHVGTVTSTYTVLTWTLLGFYAPVSSDSDVVNLVKGGATVPLKFEIFDGDTELTATSAVAGFTVQPVSCTSLADEDVEPVGFTTTGGTVLRYDAAAGQFIQNWLVPKKSGVCYRTTLTAQDGTPLSAYFMTR